MSFSKILEARKAAELLAAEVVATAATPAPTTDGPLYYWTRGKEEIVAPTKPGFGWKQTGIYESRPRTEEAKALALVEPVIAAKPEPTPEPSLEAAPVWVHRTTGEILQAAKKPGFLYRPATPEETALVLAPHDLPDAEPVEEATTPVEAGFDLDSLAAAFEKARFTKEEALEERAAIADLLATDPALAQVMAASSIPLNAGQLRAACYAKQGKSFVLTGAAGTGKTTAQAATIDILDKEGAFGVHDFKYIGEAPSIAICAFTKVAVRNIQKAIRKNPRIAHYDRHCMTIHALLEFEPVVEERRDEDTGSLFGVRVFRPKRNVYNPLHITHLIIEEASMVGLDLFRLLADAILPGIQIIYLGDINQLQPVFSKPILAYALVKLPVIELTRVYRQALDNPIIANAHAVLKGQPIVTSDCKRVSVVTGTSKVQVGQLKMAMAIKQQLTSLFHAGFYDPEEDQILLPWNKQELGTKAINQSIASMLGAHRNAVVYQVRAGRNTWWLAVGDKMLIDKRIGLIVSIEDNPKYIGPDCVPPGSYARCGTPILGGTGAAVDFDAKSPDGIDYSNFSMSDVEIEEGARAASHIITVQWVDADDAMDQLSTAGEFSDSRFDFAYAMTVHKAQGSEWRKVFMVIHRDHLAFLSRELMYTALTRASEEFILFAKEELVAAACLKQEIKGTSLQDKIEYFIGGALGDLDQIAVEFPK